MINVIRISSEKVGNPCTLLASETSPKPCAIGAKSLRNKQGPGQSLTYTKKTYVSIPGRSVNRSLESLRWYVWTWLAMSSDYLSPGAFPLKCTPSTSCFSTPGFQTSSPKDRDVCEADMDDEPAFGAPEGAAATEVPQTASKTRAKQW